MLEGFGLSDPGCVRPNNEDYFISDSESGIFILADGMGGANAGEFASRLSAETLYEYLLKHPRSNGADPHAGVVEPGFLEPGFLETNWTVRKAALTEPSLEGMGTTLVAVQDAGGGSVHVSSVGDSRAYIFSQGKLELLTQD